MATVDLSSTALGAVVSGCREEARRHRSDEQGYCFELFRRALEQRDQGAWAALSEQYHLLILDWVLAARVDPEIAEDAAREAFERFWRTLVGKVTPLASRFAHVGALLKYLQQCAVTTVLDRRRRELQRVRLDERIRGLRVPAVDPGFEEESVVRLTQGDMLARVRSWIAEEISDPAELLVLRLSFSGGLSPAEIAEAHPELFASPAVVRQVKERVLRRARRSLADGGIPA